MEQFIEELKEALCERFSDAKVSVSEVLKVNDRKLHALSIRQNKAEVSPVIYCDSYYDEYLGGRGIDEIAEDIGRLYLDNKTLEGFEPETVTDYEKVKTRIRLRLINKARNEIYLKSRPHRDYLDFAIIYYVELDDSKVGIMSVSITDSMIKLWGVSEEELYELAFANTVFKDRFTLKDVCDHISRVYPELDSDDCRGMLYVATNESALFGACAILCEELLAEFAAKLKTDLIILPSSVHEMIIMPFDSKDVSELKNTVAHVNETCVSDGEYLSDNIYIYNRKDKAIRIYE